MATILFNNVNTTPIPYFSSNNNSIHNPNGVDANILKITLWEDYMVPLGMSYNLLKTHWTWVQDTTTTNESNLLESLIVHSYNTNLFEKYGRKFTQTKLIDLIELNLKNMKDYLQAVKSFIELVQIPLVILKKKITI